MIPAKSFAANKEPISRLPKSDVGPWLASTFFGSCSAMKKSTKSYDTAIFSDS
jgi:hypothetical protein